jgi:hypothetical protein
MRPRAGHALIVLRVIAGLDPAIYVADKSAWTTELSPVVTKSDEIAL